MKRIFLKLFSVKELWEEIQRREFLLPPNLRKEFDEKKIYSQIRQQFPKFIELLKIREYNLTRDIFSDLNFLNGRRFELRSLIGKLEESSQITLTKEEQKQQKEIYSKVNEGIKQIREQLTKIF